MKRILAGILSAAIVFGGVSVMANQDPYAVMPINEEDIMLIAEDAQETAETEITETKMVYEGIVGEVGEGFIILKDQNIQLNTDAATYVADYDLMPYEGIKAGDFVTAIANIATTRSIPAQTYASYVLVKTSEEKQAPIYATVASNDGEVIMSADGNNKFVLSEETEVTAHKIRIALRAADITVGSEIFVNTNMVGFSIPAHVVTEKITVMHLAQAEATEEAEEIEEVSEFPAAYGPVTKYGIVESVTEEGIFLKDLDLVLKTDENTFIADYDLMPYAGIKAGDEVVAIIDEAMTMSIPAQSYAHYILVKTSEDKAAPIYAQVASNDGEVIMSADGNNKFVLSEETEVTAHRIRIALRAADITVGSDIFVNASIIGMSIPAHVVAEKITVMRLAEKASDVKAIIVDGEEFEVAFDYEKDGDIARLPLRAALEGIGFEIGWNDETKSVTMAKGDNKAELNVAVTVARSIDNVMPVIINDRTYVTNSIFNLVFGENAKVEENDGVISVTTK